MFNSKFYEHVEVSSQPQRTTMPGSLKGICMWNGVGETGL